MTCAQLTRRASGANTDTKANEMTDTNQQTPLPTLRPAQAEKETP